MEIGRLGQHRDGEQSGDQSSIDRPRDQGRRAGGVGAGRDDMHLAGVNAMSGEHGERDDRGQRPGGALAALAQEIVQLKKFISVFETRYPVNAFARRRARRLPWSATLEVGRASP